MTFAPRIPLSNGLSTIPGMYIISMLSAFFIGSPLIGIGLGFLTHKLVKMFTHYKTDQIAKVKLGLENHYHDNGLIDRHDLVSLIQKGDDDFIEDMIKHMNIEQLLVMKDVMGKEKLTALIASKNEEHFRLLYTILSLDPETKPAELRALLSKPQILAVARQYPLIARLLQMQLSTVKDPDVQRMIQKIYRPLQWDDDTSIDPHPVTLQINEKPYQVDLNLAKIYSATINQFVTDVEHSKEAAALAKLFVDFEEPTIRLVLDLLNERPVAFDKQKLLDIIPLCDKLHINSEIIEYYLLAHKHEFSEEEMMFIVSSLSDLKHLPAILEKQLVDKTINEEDWFDKWNIAKDLQMSSLKYKCKNYVHTHFWRTLFNPKYDLEIPELWLSIFKEILDEEEFNTYFQNQGVRTIEPLLTKENLPRIFTFVNKFCLKTLKDASLNYCTTHAAALKQNLPWKFAEIPDEIATILYPKAVHLPHPDI